MDIKNNSSGRGIVQACNMSMYFMVFGVFETMYCFCLFFCVCVKNGDAKWKKNNSKYRISLVYTKNVQKK